RITASLARGWLEAGAQVGAVWDRQVIAPASGQPQSRRLLDGLARLPDTPGPALVETLAAPACRGFRDGLQVIVTTDTALAGVGRACPGDNRQRWVVLRSAAFSPAPAGSPTPRADLPLRPWLWIDSPERIPALLRGGWKEARHGS